MIILLSAGSIGISAIIYLTTQTENRIISGGVSYASPTLSRTQYDRAGEVLATTDRDDPQRADAIETVGEWRMSHVFPLEVTKEILSQRAGCLGSAALVSQRIKRIESVESKLRRDGTRLTQMQDVGGCRVVINGGTTEQISKVVASLQCSQATGEHGVLYQRTTDYIASPKDDGYRSIHVILAYQGPHQEYKGLKTEIQIRTRIQHMWATSVEICETFTGKNLRVRESTADKIWQRFFALTASYLASVEGMPSVPGTPERRDELVAEIHKIDSEIDALNAFLMWKSAHKAIPPNPDYYYFVLDLQPKKNFLAIASYTRAELPLAEKMYLEAEEDSRDDLARQVVMVSVDKLDSLKDAYPNYFIDATAFRSTIQAALR